MIDKCTQFYVDGTFKSCPQTYYQIINFAGYLPDIKSIVPIFMVPTTSKSEYIYNKIFNDIKDILKDNNIIINESTMRFMVDFEKGLINSIKNNFPRATIDGCFFHYSKLLWNKSRNLGLCKKDNLKITKILIFIFKLFPFILYDERIDIFKKIEEYYIDEKYKKFINYYKRNWLNNSYINYTELSNDEYVLRTNNYIERFHGLMNQSLDAVHPKISFLISKYEIFLKNIYNKITTSLVNKANEKEEKFSVIKDILLFLSK